MIEVRDATEADLEPMLAIYNDAVANTTAVFDREPRTLETERAWFAGKRDGNMPVLAAVEEGTVCGFASYGIFRPWPCYLHSVEHSVYVGAQHRRRGAGSALLRALVERARAEHYHTMIAGIEAGNEASIRLHALHEFARVGYFRQVGWKFDRWLDLLFMQRML